MPSRFKKRRHCLPFNKSRSQLLSNNVQNSTSKGLFWPAWLAFEREGKGSFRREKNARGARVRGEFGSRKSEVGSRKKISCEQRFLSCMALSAYEVVRVAVTYSILLQ